MPRLTELSQLAGVAFDRVGGDAEIGGYSEDSRNARPGDLFLCLPFDSGDTHRFLPDAAAKGVTAALVHSAEGFEEARRLGLAAALVAQEGTRFNDALWRLCRFLSGDPSAEMRVVGVTGTNGKTTTAHVLRDAQNALGCRAGYLGTLGIQTPSGSRELNNTTPFAPELWRLLGEAKRSGCTDLAMEISSHALEQHRSDGIGIDAAIFTNLTQDHLDFHGTMEAYAAAKRRLFDELPGLSDKRFVGAVNVDDPVGAQWAGELKCPVLTFGLNGGDLVGRPLQVRVDGLTMELGFRGETVVLESRLGGNFNVSNLLSACAGLLALGYSLSEAALGLASAMPVPGRFEPVPNDRGFGILVDYAHTPDALEKLLLSVRELGPRRLITVFGCGGDRDKTKRPKMAAVASRLSDWTVVTSDNPRTEDPAEILRDVAAGLQPAGSDARHAVRFEDADPGVAADNESASGSVLIIDRREAVAHAVRMAGEGDVVVIAGKGHENYQIIGKTKFPMDDRELAREGLMAVGPA